MKTNSLLLLLSLLGTSLIAHAGTSEGIDQLLTTRACPGCQLQNSDLSGLDLSGVDLSGAILDGSNLHQTNLRGANLNKASLLNVKLSDTALSGANLTDADLSDMDIDQVFEYTEIIGTQFEGAKFKHGVVCGPAPFKGGWGCQQL